MNNLDVFWYICGEYIVKENDRLVCDFMKRAFLASRLHKYSPTLVLKTCDGGRKDNDCYLCLVNIKDINRNNSHRWIYPILDSTISHQLDQILVPIFISLPTLPKLFDELYF